VNYRHAFHAGNFADVVKHVALALCLDRLNAKETPYRYIDTHAGIGRYSLTVTSQCFDVFGGVVSCHPWVFVLAPYDSYRGWDVFIALGCSGEASCGAVSRSGW